MPTETVKKALPWRAGTPAWIMAVEGLIIAILGMYIIQNQTGAVRILLIALGVLMLFNGVPRLSRYYNGPAEGKQEGDLLQGWYGTVVGAGAIGLTLLSDNPENLAGVVFLFGIALIIGGILDLFDRFSRNKGNRRLALFIMPIILIVAGLSLVTLRVSSTLTPELIGQILALLGFALFAIGLLRVYGNRKARRELAEAEVQRDKLDKQIADANARNAAAAGAAAAATPAPAAPAPAPAPAPAATAPAPAPAAPPAEPEDPAVAASRDVPQ